MQQQGQKIDLEHEKRIRDLENNYKTLENRMSNIENSQLRIENTVLNEGRETRDLLTTIVTHNQTMDTQKMDLWKSIVITAISSGGVLYLIIEVLLKK